MKQVPMVIDGELVPPSEDSYLPSVNPYTGETWAAVAQATPEVVDRAVRAARTAFDERWRSLPGVERATLMMALADALSSRAEQFARWESTDNGKVIRETVNQMHFAARNLRFFAGYADKLYGRTIPLDKPTIHDYTVRKPYGVVAVITAWNSPISLLANKLPPALAAGNTVVIKPSEHASVTTCELARLALEVGFPPGVINVVCGAGEIGTALIGHELIGKITFTGGTVTGRAVAEIASRRLVPVTLELGGKSPNIIFEDADLDAAVVGALAGIFGASGQTCIAGSRLLVQESVYEQVVKAITERAQHIKLGDPLDPATEMGPVANRPQFERILSFIESAGAEGATLNVGGHAAATDDSSDALFIAPTVFSDVRPDMTLAQEEIFGPVLAILPFATEEDAVRMANASEYGLAAGVWTRDLARSYRVSDQLEAGVVWVNTYRTSAAQAPFGGVKQSGYGRERGEEALLEYTYIKNVFVDYSGDVRDPFSIQT